MNFRHVGAAKSPQGTRSSNQEWKSQTKMVSRKILQTKFRGTSLYKSTTLFHGPWDFIPSHRPRVCLEPQPSDVTSKIVECFWRRGTVCRLQLFWEFPQGLYVLPCPLLPNHYLWPFTDRDWEGEDGIHLGILVLRYGFQGLVQLGRDGKLEFGLLCVFFNHI